MDRDYLVALVARCDQPIAIYTMCPCCRDLTCPWRLYENWKRQVETWIEENDIDLWDVWDALGMDEQTKYYDWSLTYEQIAERVWASRRVGFIGELIQPGRIPMENTT